MKRCEANTLDRRLPFSNAYWNERDTRNREAKEAAHQRELDARIDRALIASGNRWPAHWTDAEKTDAERRVK
jgi:hypothetical protein